MDFDESTIEDYERHDVNSYLFSRLLKFRLDNKGTMAEDSLRIKENVSNCSAKDTDQFSYHPPVEFPLMKVLNENVKKTFDKMDELFPALPCEFKKKKFRLGKMKAGITLSLVIEISNLLTRITKTKEIVWDRDLKNLIKELSNQYEIILYSVYSKETTNKLMDELDKDRKLVSRVIGIESVIERENYKIIDLRVLEDRNPNQIIVVTGSLTNLTGWLENGIYLELNEGTKEKLMATKEFLLNLPKTEDIKSQVKRFSGLIRIFKIYNREKFLY